MAKKLSIKLHKSQMKILEAIQQGEMLTIDSSYMAWLGDISVHPKTRHFFTQNRLITRKNKKKAVTAKGNGYIITEKGIEVLKQNKDKIIAEKEHSKKTIKAERVHSPKTTKKEYRGKPFKTCPGCKKELASSMFVDLKGNKNPRGRYCVDCREKKIQEEKIKAQEEQKKLSQPTERQLKYAKDLGINIPPYATKNDLSDLISTRVAKDKPSTKRHRKFAELYDVKTTEYIGKKNLFDQIKGALMAPGKEKELLSWFTFRIYRKLIKGKHNTLIQTPDHPTIQKIAERFGNDIKIINSVRRYEGRDLIWFGEWTSPEGRVYNGGSINTIAYKTIAPILKVEVNISSSPKKKPKLKSSKTSRKIEQNTELDEIPKVYKVIAVIITIIILYYWLV